MGLVPFGIPDENPSQRKKPLSEIVHFDKWQNSIQYFLLQVFLVRVN